MTRPTCARCGAQAEELATLFDSVLWSAVELCPTCYAEALARLRAPLSVSRRKAG